MIVKTEGIVFRSLKYRDTSIIVDIYTKELGLRSYIVNGVRKQKASQHASNFQRMSILDLLVYENENKDLQRIKENRFAYTFNSIPFHIARASVGTFLLELSQKCIKEKEENQNLFNFLKEWFVFLDLTGEAVSNLHILFMVELAAYLGFRPTIPKQKDSQYFDMMEGTFSESSPNHPYFMTQDETHLFVQFLKSSKDLVHAIPLNQQRRQNILDKLLIFYRLHVENFNTLNSIVILKELWK